MSTYTGVTNFRKTVRFLAHPVDTWNSVTGICNYTAVICNCISHIYSSVSDTWN